MTRPLRELEKQAILQAVVDTGFNVNQAAHDLRITAHTIYCKFKRWGLESPMAGGNVKRSVFLRRCEAITRELLTVTLGGENLGLPIATRARTEVVGHNLFHFPDNVPKDRPGEARDPGVLGAVEPG